MANADERKEPPAPSSPHDLDPDRIDTPAEGAQHARRRKGASRREFLAGAAAASVGLALLNSSQAPAAGQSPPIAAPAARPGAQAGAVPITLNVNGQDHPLLVEPRVTLLDALRERLQMTGTKKGCDHGQCGACTVHVDGRRINSCLTLAIMHQGQKITTIEGLAQGDNLHPMQAAFVEHDGFQCGYCTPGQIMSAVGLVNEGHAATVEDIREQMSGNICRCGAYPNIVAAVQQVLEGR